MAYANLGSDKVNVPFRTEEGARGLIHPELPNERKKLLDGCVGCTKVSAHAPCEFIGNEIAFGERRHQLLAPENRVRVEDLWRVMTALWAAGYIHHPYDNGDLPYNAGGANNQAQAVFYEIVSVSGSRMRLKGRNPKLIVLGNSVPNPDWPGSGGRYLMVDHICSLPVGSQVEFLQPSVLAGKLTPWIKKVHAPASDDLENVEFDVDLSCPVTKARRPLDMKWPPFEDRYSCRIWWWALQPEAWPRVEVTEETQFTRRDVVATVASLPGDKRWPLLRSDGAETRILFPGMLSPGTVAVAAEVSGVWVWKGEDWILPRLVTTQVAYNSWTTRVELADLLTEFPTATRVRAIFHPEAVAADTFRMPWASGCANCQRDRSASYVHHDGWRCMEVNATGFENFKRRCWQPVGKAGSGCDRFGLGSDGDRFGPTPVAAPIPDVRTGSLWARLYQRSSWVIQQGLPGASSSRAFSVSMPAGGGTSLASLCGGWSDGVPIGFFASVRPLYGSPMGKREEFEDEDGPNHRLVPGLYAAQKPWVAGTAPTPGVLPSLVSGWGSRENALGGAMGDRLGQFPTRGAGHTGLHTWAFGGSGFGLSNRLVGGQEVFVTGINPLAVDGGFAEEIRRRFA